MSFCLKSAARYTHELILLDLKLPKVDGIEVPRQFKSDPRTKAIPVVVVATSKEEKDLARCSELGVNRYLQKPVDFDSLRETTKQFAMSWLLSDAPPPEGAIPEN